MVAAATITTQHRAFGLQRKITGVTAATLAVTGLVVAGIAHRLVSSVLNRQAELRALAVARQLSDSSAPFVVGKNLAGLQGLLAKHALLDQVAYVFVEDGSGRVLSQTLGGFPKELEATLSRGSRDEARQFLRLGGGKVIEARVPMMEADGVVHVGIWLAPVRAEARRILLPVMFGIVLVVACAIALAVVLVRRVTRPIARLCQVADRMSRGDFDSPARDTSTDGVGNLADSLERLRASLKAAMTRFDRSAPASPPAREEGAADPERSRQLKT